MTFKPVTPGLLARRDIEAAVDYYAAEAGPRVAEGFIEALQAAYRTLGFEPALGSLRYAFELNLPELRVWPLPRYPFLIFYVEKLDRVDVWRVLHARRDIPAFLQDVQA